MNQTLVLFTFIQILFTINAYNVIKNIPTRSHVGNMIMKKGKAGKIPIDRRGQYIKQQQMAEAYAKYNASKPKGVPNFKIFVRLKTGSPWVACSELSGDKKATSLVNAWTSGFMTDFYKSQLDQGLARSIFSQEDNLAKSIAENYQPFRKFTKDQLEFGYTVDFEGVVEKMGEQKVTPLVKGMEKTWVDNLKDSWNGLFSSEQKA